MLRHFKRRDIVRTKNSTIRDDLVIACRMTATVDASYFCFRSIIVAALLLRIGFFCKRMMN